MFRKPQTPLQFGTLLDGLPTRDTASIARYLDVSERSLARWKADDQAPRAVMLALYWETHHGCQALYTDMWNDRQMAEALARSSQALAANLQARVAYLERLSDFGCANSPAIHPTVATIRRGPEWDRQYRVV